MDAGAVLADVADLVDLAGPPAHETQPHGIEAQHPDKFLSNHLNLAPGTFCSSVQKVRRRLKNPPYSVEQYLENLLQQGLVATVAELKTFAQLL